MAYFKCDNCKSILFEQIQPSVFDESDVRVFGTGLLILPDHVNVTVLKCLRCGIIHIPSCSLMGKNALDKDVQVFKELYNVIGEYNKEIVSNSFNNIKNIKDNFLTLTSGNNSINSEIVELKKSIQLINDNFNTPKEDLKKNVKTSRPRKTNS